MLQKHTKNEVFNQLINLPNFLGKYKDYDGIVTFLNKIWPLKELPSQDNRYKNAYDDAYQHLVNNNDWPLTDTFLDRFNLIDGDEKYFISFIEAIVNPIVRESKDEIIFFVSKINNIIQKDNYKLVLMDYFETLPVYRYTLGQSLNDLPLNIKANNIPIYLDKPNLTKDNPCFVLQYNSWNDYGKTTSFYLDYYDETGNEIYIGKVKIMKRDNVATWDTLKDQFFSLENDNCSLGQDKNYYYNLKNALGQNYNSFLLAMRDVANFPKIHEQFENDEIYKDSLIRGNVVEQLSRTIRYEIEGVNPDEYYKFNYTYKLPYAEESIVLNFDFEYNTNFEHRIYALIGKNGTGKTKILSSLARNLSEDNTSHFAPRRPVYGKVFTVSYSFFDSFDIPSSDASFNYVYCGLKKSDNSWKTEEELLAGFYESVILIKKKELENDWYKILSNFIVPEILNMAFDINEGFLDEYVYTFNEGKFNDVKNYLSSGQSIILYMISGILAHIRYDSLILFDEPETHLHPNAISALLNTLFELVKRFKSFCVIATHSPMIIQEIPARNIFVIEREDNRTYVRSLERESFGENLTVITQDIFGNRDVSKHFILLIQGLINKGNTYEEIVAIIESANLPITSNIRLYIKALMPQQ